MIVIDKSYVYKPGKLLGRSRATEANAHGSDHGGVSTRAVAMRHLLFEVHLQDVGDDPNAPHVCF